MASTCRILVVCVILLGCLSLSSAVVKRSVSENFKKHANHDVQQSFRDKRQEDTKNSSKETDNLVKQEDKFPKFQTIHDRRITEEAIDQRADRKDEEQNVFHNDDTTKEDAEDDAFSYKNMHDLIQAFILADKEDKLQLQEAENSTESDVHNSLPKRHVAATAAAAAAAAASTSAGSDLLGANLWDVIPLTDLDAHSCGVEAFEYGHVHVSGVMVHEFFCELRKLWHYVLIVLRNLKSGLTLGPLIAENTMDSHASIFQHFAHHCSRFLQIIVREPHHLVILPEIIRDAIPFPSITGAIHRFAHIFFKLIHFARDLLSGHIRHICRHFFSHHHLGVFLREKLLAIKPARLNCLRGLGSILPVEEIITEPVTSISSATASATATATTYQDDSAISNYHKSLAECLTSFRGAYDGYYASGMPHLIKTGMKSISSTTTVSTITSYLSKLPFRRYLSGCEPSLIEDKEISASSSAAISSSISSTRVPAISPIVPIAPVLPIESETVSSSASASAAAVVATETQPVIPSVPVSSYIPLIEPTLSPMIVSNFGNTISENGCSTAPEIKVPGNLRNIAAAASSSASSSLDVAPAPIISPLITRKYRPRPILPTATPTTVSSVSSSSASASAGDISVGPNRDGGFHWNEYGRLRNPLIRPWVLPSIDSSMVTSSSAASSASTSASSSALSAASSSASAVSSPSNSFNLVFPREKIINALGYDCLLPGDIVTVTLKNRPILFGCVFDTVSPITFNILKPRLHASLIRNSRRIWNLLARDFRDPECIQKLNNPLLLHHVF